MAQLSFVQNYNFFPKHTFQVSFYYVYFVPFNIEESISLLTVNFIKGSGGYFGENVTGPLKLGLYSLNASTLSLANFISGNFTWRQDQGASSYISLTATSSAQNITPGTWWFGIWSSLPTFTSNTSSSQGMFYGNSRASANNNFPGSFIGGRMTNTTSDIPSSVATSDLDTTGMDAMIEPLIMLSA